jgi:mannose-P-dolichol utilization defect 1
MEALAQPLQNYLVTPLRPYLLPLASALPDPINTFLLTLLGPTCHSALLLDLSLTHPPECFALLISKTLGFAIIGASSIVKVPQILKLASSRSARGLSFPACALETTAFLLTLAYNARQGFPFSTYGETALILVQDAVLGVLILLYSNNATLAGAFLAGLLAAASALLLAPDLVSDAQMTTLAGLAGTLAIASKLPQIWTVYRQGGTGQLSAFAVFMFLFGSLSRIYTTLQEVDDKVILYGFVAGGVLNAVLAVQMAYYWNAPGTAEHGRGERDAVGAGLEKVGTKAAATGSEVKRPGSSSGRRRG